MPKKELLISRLEGVWKTALGHNIALHTAPFELKGKLLFIKVDDPVWVAELTLQKDDLLARLKEALADASLSGLLGGVRFIAGKLPPKKEPAPERPLILLSPEELGAAKSVSQSAADEALQTALMHYLTACAKREKIEREKR